MEIKGKKVLVTGGAGFIGSNLVDELVKRGNKVSVLDDMSIGCLDNLKTAQANGDVEVFQGSILDMELVRRAMKDVNVVFHMAVQCLRLSFDQPMLVHEVNATGTLNVLRAAEERMQEDKSGFEKFAYVSSSEVYGSGIKVPMTEDHPLMPTTVYGASKLAGELYTDAFYRTYDMPTVVLRPFNTYGYREHFEGVHGEVIPRFLVRMLNGMAPVIFGDGSQTRDFTFVTDTVDGLIRAASHEGFNGQAVNIARGEEVTIKDIALMMIEVLGYSDMKPEFGDDRPADVLRHYANITKLSEATGYKPAISIKEGLKLYIDWFKEQHPDAKKLLSECDAKNWKVEDAKVLSPTTN